MSKQIDVLYERVFDSEGDIRLCGRVACIELMQAMAARFCGESFGDESTGFMDFEKIKEYYWKINGEDADA